MICIKYIPIFHTITETIYHSEFLNLLVTYTLSSIASGSHSFGCESFFCTLFKTNGRHWQPSCYNVDFVCSVAFIEYSNYISFRACFTHITPTAIEAKANKLKKIYISGLCTVSLLSIALPVSGLTIIATSSPF